MSTAFDFEAAEATVLVGEHSAKPKRRRRGEHRSSSSNSNSNSKQRKIGISADPPPPPPAAAAAASVWAKDSVAPGRADHSRDVAATRIGFR